MAEQNSSEKPCLQQLDIIQGQRHRTSARSSSEVWFVQSEVEGALTKDVIKSVLTCPCQRCDEHRRKLDASQLTHPDFSAQLEEHVDRVYGREGKRGGRVLFALLIYIRFPMLVIPLVVEGDRSDEALTTHCEDASAPKYLKKWPEAERKFVKHMFQFNPQKIEESPMYSNFSKHTVMPFRDERPVSDQGVSSTVYEFRIQREYISESIGNYRTRFARKQYKGDSPPVQFLKERRNLARIQDLQDPHIVRVYKCYQRGSEYNIIFPLAMGNLDDFLLQPVLGLKSLTTGPIHKVGLWKQMHGIAKALERVINFDSRLPDDEVYRDLEHDTKVQHSNTLGYHFDIKPANILIFHNEEGLTFQLTDFGQATFSTIGGNRDVHSRGGTPDYAPPEGNSISETRINTRYDVWSLGCVFVELLVFLRQGATGVETFRKNRKKRIDAHEGNSFFYDESPDDDPKYTLRESVDDTLKDVLSLENASRSEIQCLEDIQELLRGMLQPIAGERMRSREVVERLTRIIERNYESEGESVTQLKYITQGSERSIPYPNVMNDNSPDVILKLSDLSQMYARRRTKTSLDFQRCNLQDGGTEDLLRLCIVTKENDQTIIVDGSRAREDVQVVAKFAFREHQDHRRMGDHDIMLMDRFGPWDYVFQAGDLQEARKMQGFLTGQQVQESFDLKSFEFGEYTGRFPKLRGGKAQSDRKGPSRLFHHFRPSNKSSHTNGKSASGVDSQSDDDIEKDYMHGTENHGPYTIQLWREANPSTPSDQVLSSRLTRSCRLVLFNRDNFHIIPICDENQSDCDSYIEENDRETKEPTSFVKLYSATPSQPMLVYYFGATKDDKSDDKNGLPSIPADVSILREKEKDSKKTVSSLELQFMSSKKADRFRRYYLNLKQDWELETGRLRKKD